MVGAVFDGVRISQACYFYLHSSHAGRTGIVFGSVCLSVQN